MDLDMEFGSIDIWLYKDRKTRMLPNGYGQLKTKCQWVLEYYWSFVIVERDYF